jgi:hypothetical protein
VGEKSFYVSNKSGIWTPGNPENPRERTPGFMASRSVKIGTEGICGLPGCGVLLQKEIHAIEIDNGVALVERVDSQNAVDSGAALLQCEAR